MNWNAPTWYLPQCVQSKAIYRYTERCKNNPISLARLGHHPNHAVINVSAIEKREPVSGFVTPYVVASSLDSWSKILRRKNCEELQEQTAEVAKKRVLGCVTKAPNFVGTEKLRNLVLVILTKTAHYLLQMGIRWVQSIDGSDREISLFLPRWMDGKSEWESGCRVNSRPWLRCSVSAKMATAIAVGLHSR